MSIKYNNKITEKVLVVHIPVKPNKRCTYYQEMARYKICSLTATPTNNVFMLTTHKPPICTQNRVGIRSDLR